MPTDRQFTGQRWEASLGFYDYVARQYNPVLGRFLQADTIIPDPANPQSLNRYAYVLNNPLRYTDPTGHAYCPTGNAHCIDDSPAPRSQSGNRRDSYGVRFTADTGQTWHIKDQNTVLDTASRIAAAMWRALAESYQIGGMGLDPAIWNMPKPLVLFQKTMGNVIFHRSASSCSSNCWAFTANPRITVYTNVAHGHYTYHNAAHEMGHLLAQRTGWSRGNWQAYADLNAAQIELDDGTIVAGGGWPGLGYQRTNLGYATPRGPWQQNRTPTPNEDFADMFLGWAYNHFASNPAGAARYQWMNTNMPRWMALAVSATP